MTSIAVKSTVVPTTLKITRIESIDLLRGVVMIIMALDHVRDYFHADAYSFNPTDLDKTNVALFLTRFITHYCAPTFVFLAGTSAFMVGRRKGKNELAAFLFKRGLWILVLEFTIINFGWFANIEFKILAFTVIWALGIGMISLAAFIYLPYVVILATGLLIVFGHNVLDTVHVQGDGAASIFWSFLHEPRVIHVGRFDVYMVYSVLPWIGIMLLGYCFGALYNSNMDAGKRKFILINLGATALILFVVLRAFTTYGDANVWTIRQTPAFTWLSFINVTKYPPSLLYALVTLGPALIFLAYAENMNGRISASIKALGRVPMFYYILHIYTIHFLAFIAAWATGFELRDMIFDTWITDAPQLKTYGFNLDIVYVIWIIIVALLLPICKRYDRYKIRNKEKWWLSYL